MQMEAGSALQKMCDVHFRRVPGARRNAIRMLRATKAISSYCGISGRVCPMMKRSCLLPMSTNVKGPTTPTPILTVASKYPGVGKNLQAPSALSEIDDPCDGNLIVKPRRYDDFAMSLAKYYTLNWDNASPIIWTQFSDMACNACTGGFYEKRLHHKNRETTIAEPFVQPADFFSAH